MLYNVLFLFNTRANLINTADNGTILESFASSTLSVPAININSVMGLNEIVVNSTYENLKGADYVKLYNSTGSFYFNITGDILPYATDSSMCVPIHIDGWITTGGISNIRFLDGFVSRHHIAKADDIFGKYTEVDPYLTPSEPLKIVDGGILYTMDGSDRQIIEASLDLGAMGESTYASALTYTDGSTTEKVTVPKTIPLDNSNRTGITMTLPDGTTKSTITPVTTYYDASHPTAQAGLAKCRDLGAEGAILNSWVLPNNVWAAGSVNANTGHISSIQSTAGNTSSGLPFEYGTVRNKKVLTGYNNRYVLQSVASGNIGEFNPEHIYHSGDISPHVCRTCDPRPEGKPYFRFEYFLDSTDFFMNCIPGLSWQKAPLMYSTKSGSTIDRTIFYSERADEASIFGTRQAQSGLGMALNAGSAALSTGLGAMSGAANVSAQAAGSHGVSSIAGYHNAANSMNAGIASGIYNGSSGLVSGGVGMYVSQSVYDMQKKKEMRRFAISQAVVTPQIQYPREDSLRDFLGNGVRVYRYRLSDHDLQKADTISEMYGYKDTDIIKPEFFNNRSKFNYVECQGVSIIRDDIPEWLRNEIAEQLENGIRIWHVKPDTTAYTDGTNV